MWVFLVRLVDDETGQDLIEYALLTTVVGIAGAVAIDLIGSAIASTYGSWETNVNSHWESPAPGGGS